MNLHNHPNDTLGVILGFLSYPIAIFLNFMPAAESVLHTSICAGIASISGYLCLKLFKYFEKQVKKMYDKASS